MRYKTARIKKQFGNANPRLRGALLEIDDVLQQTIKKELFLTCLNRTAKQNSIAGGSPQSYHMKQPCSAADIRTTTQKWFTKDEVSSIVRHFNRWHRADLADRCIVERDHIHIQMTPMWAPEDDEPMYIGTVL